MIKLKNFKRIDKNTIFLVICFVYGGIDTKLINQNYLKIFIKIPIILQSVILY